MQKILEALSEIIELKSQSLRNEAESYGRLSQAIKGYLAEEVKEANENKRRRGRPEKLPILNPLPTLEQREYMSLKDVIKMTGIGRTKLYKEMNEGRLQASKCGRQTLISQENFKKWVAGFSRY
jgi:excisionase family DNA binding protein